MSEHDQRAFEEYLSRSSTLSKRYRELDMNEVPAELDAQILTAARQAVQPPRHVRWRRWGAPLALAASVMLAVTIALDVGVDREQSIQATYSEAPVQNAPVPQSESGTPQGPAFDASPPAASSSPSPAIEPQRAARAQRAEEEASEQRASAKPSIENSTVNEQAPVLPEVSMGSQAQAPAPPATPAPTARSRTAPAAFARKRSEPLSSTGAVTPGALDGREKADEELDAARKDPKAWLERIRKLRGAGQHAQADAEWERFRKTFPEYELDETDAAARSPLNPP